MLKNYFKIALRTYKNQTGYTFINILGLAFGLACAILIFLYINNELKYDSQFPHYENTYRLGYRYIDAQGEVDYDIWIPSGWDDYLRDQLEEVTGNFQYWWFGNPCSVYRDPNDKILMTEEMFFVQDNIAEMAYFPVIEGNKELALKEPNSIVISQKIADQFFPKGDALNSPLTIVHPWATNNEKLELTVTGVMENYPENTHFKADYLINYRALRPFMDFGDDMTFEEMELSLTRGWFYSYIVTRPGADMGKITKLMADKVDEIFNDNPEMQEDLEGGRIDPDLVWVGDMHFDENYPWENEGRGDMMYIYTFGSIAILIIIVACINYINLATARSAKRSKEVGLRKALGSERKELIIQFMVESVIVVFFSFLVALLMVLLLLPVFNSLAGKTISFVEIFQTDILLLLSGLFVLVSLLSGSYPALYVSGFNPVDVLKGQFSFSSSSNYLRKILVSAQFAIAIILLIATVIVSRQMTLMQGSKLNSAGEQVLSIRYGGTVEDDKFQTFKTQVTRDKDIDYVTFGNHLPRLDFFGPLEFAYRMDEINEEEFRWNTFRVDFDFPKTFGLEFLAGRDFDPDNSADSSNIVINEALCEVLGKTPEEVIGTQVTAPRMINYWNWDYDDIQSGQVIGVVKDFPYMSCYNPIDPLVLYGQPHFIDRILYVKLPEENIQEKIAYIEDVWRQLFPEIGLDYWFIDEEFNRMYRSENQIASMSKSFTGLAILITCVGLFGLASFTTEQKTKEIGIRKAMGASNMEILFLILKIFLRTLTISCLVGIPIAWYFSYQWLQNFIFRTSINWEVILISLGIIGLLTVLTVSYESLKASMTNPIKALKHE